MRACDPDPPDLVSDRLAISDLVHAYAQGVDRRDPEAVARLFVEDGTFVAYATPGAAEATSRSQGHAEIVRAIGMAKHFRSNHPHHREPPGHRRRSIARPGRPGAWRTTCSAWATTAGRS